MAHELMFSNEGNASMMYVGELPWHQLGTKLRSPPTATEAIVAAGLNWRVEKAPLFYHASASVTGIVPKHFAVVPTEGWKKSEHPVFGVVSKQYEPLQNAEAFSFFDPLVWNGQATYETAGALGEGERVWVMVKCKGSMGIGRLGGDEVGKYLLLSNSHDGGSAVQIKFTPIRVVCSNTLSMALSSGDALRVEHKPSMRAELSDASTLLARITERYDAIEADFRRMAAVQAAEKMLKEYFAEVFPEPPKPVTAANDRVNVTYEREIERTRVDRSCCRELFDGSRNTMPATAGTLWSAYNSVTEYVDHAQRRNNFRSMNPSIRLQSIWYGKGATTKVRAFHKALAFADGKMA